MTPHPHQETVDGFTGPLKAELPLDYLEAFRLASFGIEYQPRYGEVHWDQDCASSRMFRTTTPMIEWHVYSTTPTLRNASAAGLHAFADRLASGL